MVMNQKLLPMAQRRVPLASLAIIGRVTVARMISVSNVGKIS